MLNIVLVEPEIPSNTGNIARTCALTGSKLHLVKPLGFSVDDKHLKRAGLDYWHLLDITYYENIEDFLAKHSNDRLFLATTKAENLYSECTYQNGDYFLFGKETAGLPQWLREKYPDTCITIPMLDNPDARSLNLSNSAAIIIYEALRQLDFVGLKNFHH